MKYESTGNFGAVLVSDVDVELAGYDIRGPFIRWLEGNAATIREKHKGEIGPRTLHIVIGIYTWTEISIHVVGFKAAALGITSADVGSAWARSPVGSHWRQVSKKDNKLKKAMFMLSATLELGAFGRKDGRGSSKTE
ncbi:hypothetical protein F5883DRAFT_664541 [Diaporthe sp. PMI_573]|nr:hypothetical protein F5883DRAFT_664541 [Diaporthaceae sp. PMI_573]